MEIRTGKELSGKAVFKRISLSLSLLPVLSSTTLSLAAQSQEFNRHEARSQFALDNPGLNNAELNRAFKGHWNEIRANDLGGNGGAAASMNVQINDSTQNIQNSVSQLNMNDFATKAEFKAYKGSLKDQHFTNNLNQSIQQIETNQIVKVNAGFSLDLTSAVENITLGNNLFKQQESVTINVAGQDKTLTAGSKVTAGEYVAAKQALVAGNQTVKLDADGRATGGIVDLSAMTTGNATMKVEDLVVPVSVIASGDFGKNGDVRISGDLINSGAIQAYSTSGSTKGVLRADSITNNADASITSTLSDFTLQADSSFANYGKITSSGNLTVSAENQITNAGTITAKNNLNIVSPNVQNAGKLASSQGNISFDTPVASDMLIDNVGGTIAATHGAIDIRSADYSNTFSTAIVGGDLLSKTLNANSGTGFTDINVNALTGRINSTGYATHVNSSTDNLVIGDLDLVDPTFKNANGNITINGNIVVQDQLAIIASGNIEMKNNVSIRAESGGAGQNVTLIAGANVSGPAADTKKLSGNLVGTTNVANIDGAKVQSAKGGNLKFGTNTSINTSGIVAGSVTLIAMHGDQATDNGDINAAGLTINASATNVGGDVVITAGGDGSNTIGAISAAGNGGANDGNITISTSQAVNSLGTSPIQYLADGSLNTGIGFGRLVNSTTLTNGTLTVSGPLSTGNSNIRISSGGNLTLNGDSTAAVITLRANSGINGAGNLVSSDAVGNNVTIEAIGTIAATGLITSRTVNLTSTEGNIGLSESSRVRINAANLVANAAATTAGNGNVWVNEADSINISGASSANKQFYLTSLGSGAGSLNINGTITAGDILITTVAGSGRQINVQATISADRTTVLRSDAEINLDANIAAAQTMELTAQGSILHQSGILFGNIALLTSNSGSIGTIIPGGEIRTQVNAVTANASNGNATIIEADDLSVFNSGVNSLIGTLTVQSVSGTITLQGDLTGETIALRAGNVAGSSILTIGKVGNTETNSVALEANNGYVSINAGVEALIIDVNALSGVAVNSNLGTAESTALITINTSGFINGTGAVVGTEAVLNVLGSVGSETIPLRTNINFLSLNMTGAGQTLFLENANELSVEQASITSTGTANIYAFRTITLTGPISGNAYNFNTYNSDADIEIASSLTVNDLTLNAGRSIVADAAAIASTVNTMSLTARSGSVGTELIPIQISTPELALSAAGSAYISVTSGSTNINAANVGSVLDVVGVDEISVDGLVTAPTVNLAAVNGVKVSSTITASNLISIKNTNSIDATDFVGAEFVTPELRLTSDNGNIGASGPNFVDLDYSGTLSLNAAGNVYLRASGDISLGGETSSSGALHQFFVESANGDLSVDKAISSYDLKLTVNDEHAITLNDEITALSTTLTANDGGSIAGAGIINGQIFLLTAGSIGTANQRLNLNNTGNALLAVNSDTSAFLNITGAGTSNISTARAQNFDLVSEGGVVLAISTDLSQNVDIVSSNVFLTGDLDLSGHLNISSTTALTLNGTAQISADEGINITALNGDLTLQGQYTFDSTAQLSVQNGSSTAHLDAGAIYTATTTSYINSGNLDLQGSLVTYTPPNGQPGDTWIVGFGGTYANLSEAGTGDVILSGAINLNGNLAIIAGGNIDFTNLTSINLSGSNQGSLTILAGYTFTPDTDGKQVLDRTTTFSNFQESAVGGNILRGSNTDVTTSGGNVLVIAHSGTNGGGFISLGDINTASNPAVNGGNVTLIGTAGAGTGNINTSPTSATAGNVLIAAAEAIIPVGFSITNGAATNADLIATGLHTKGQIRFSNITAGTASVNITGALETGELSEIQGFGQISAGSLTVTSGSGTADIGRVNVGTFNSIANGSSTVIVDTLGSLNLGTITGSGQTLNLQAMSGAVTKTSGTITANILNIESTSLNLGTTVTTVNEAAFDIVSIDPNSMGTLNANHVSLTEFAPMFDTNILNGINAPSISLTVRPGSIIGTPGTRFILPERFIRGSFTNLGGNVYAGSALDSTGGFTLHDSAAIDGTFNFVGAGNLNVSGTVEATGGDLAISTAKNRITVAPVSVLRASGTTSQLSLSVTDISSAAKKTSGIKIGAGSVIETLATSKGANSGLITISVGASQAPVAGKAPKNTVVTGTVGPNQVFWGQKGITSNATGGANQFTLQGANVVFNNNFSKNAIVLDGGTNFTADPPVDGLIGVISPAQDVSSTTLGKASSLTNFETGNNLQTNNLFVQPDNSSLNMNVSSPLLQNIDATLLTVRDNSVGDKTDDDDSYLVGFMGRAAETQAMFCSDVSTLSEHVSGSSKVQALQHNENVSLKDGNVLFAPSKDTVVETPTGMIRITGKSVVLVSVSKAGMAVYDIDDQRKGSVIVESNGHRIALSPGWHTMITPHHKAEFAQINAIDAIAHRNVQSATKNGHRAHTSEFSVMTALDTVAPLKAMAKSNNSQARQIAARMIKTTAITLQLGGSAGRYEHYFKPRMTAMK